MLDRGEKIELLVDKTEKLETDAFRFKKQSTRLKHQMWWQNAKFMLLIVAVLALFIYFVCGLACGFTLKNC